MKIKKLEFHNHALDWHLEETEFNDDLSLLVGVSGVGKTQILQSILDLKNIINGRALNGAKWDISFDTDENKNYRWQGEFELKEKFDREYIIYKENEEENWDRPNIISEKLSLGNKIIVERDSDKILFDNKPTLKLSPTESIVKILKEEDKISPAYEGFSKIFFSNQSIPHDAVFDFLAKLLKEFPDKTIRDIRNSELSIEMKLIFLDKYLQNEFAEIKEQFMEIFPSIEDIKFDYLQCDKVPHYYQNTLFLHLKEKGVDDFISPWRISSGMLKALYSISELYLSADGSVFLIDEFENSLGVNCIDVVTDNLMQVERDLQFIITSHHPYIINNINMKHWKIVTRKGNAVKVRDASEFKLGKSKHDAFIQLINLDEFTDGISY